MASSLPARGNTSLIMLAPELECGIPALTGFQAYRINPEGKFELIRSEADDGSLSPSGFATEGIPTTIRDDSPTLSLRLTTGHWLDFLYHFLRKVTKTTVAGGNAFKYVFEGDVAGPDFAFTVFGNLRPVESFLRQGWKAVSVEIPMTGDAAPIIGAMTGTMSQSQSYDLAVADGGNAGSYAGPSIRGPVKFNGLGDIHVQITNTAPLEFKAEITDDATPTFDSPAIPVSVDGVTGRGTWQNAQGSVKIPGTVSVSAGTVGVVGVGTKFTKYIEPGMLVAILGEVIGVDSVADDLNLTLKANHVAGATAEAVKLIGRDLGYYDENKDNVEVVWQGDATDLSTIALSDTWVFAEEFATRNPAFSKYDRFTGAHAQHFFREIGSTDWIPFKGIASTIKMEWPVEPEEALGTRYLSANDRTGDLVAMLDPYEAVYREKNKEFIKWNEGHKRIEGKVEILGRQLGDGTVREGFVFYFPYVGVGNPTRPISGAGRLTISSTLTATTDVNEVSPVTVEVYSERDWTAPVIIV